jgi:glutathionylspermidine synthase
MKRFVIAPRADWQAAVEGQGLVWHSDGDVPYWDESAYFAFTLAQVEQTEAAIEALYDLFLEAGDNIVRKSALMDMFGLPTFCQEAIREAWNAEPPALDYGRFDLGYDGNGDPKLLEFNCDTPTSMLEAAVVQWNWKEDRFPDHDQFNSLHDKLVARWAGLAPRLVGRRAWFTHAADPAHEDTITTTYMRELAEQAGIETHGVLIDDIGLDADGRLVDSDDQLMTAIFKLYPWEWLVTEPYGRDIIMRLPETAWIEPIWKMIWSNKAILKILWDMFPNNPNLLAASFEHGKITDNYVAKPLLAREGANVTVVEQGRIIAQSLGEYAGGRMLFQQLYPLKDFGNGYPVIGSWIVAGEAAGMGIREDGLITGDRARFIPHIIEG